jgi:hypothetical protein
VSFKTRVRWGAGWFGVGKIYSSGKLINVLALVDFDMVSGAFNV